MIDPWATYVKMRSQHEVRGGGHSSVVHWSVRLARSLEVLKHKLKHPAQQGVLSKVLIKTDLFANEQRAWCTRTWPSANQIDIESVHKIKT